MSLSKDQQGYVLLGGVGLAIAVILIIKASIRHDDVGPDNCVGTPKANTVIVLDQSERISEQTREEIVARALNHIANSVGTNERVTIFAVSDLSRKSLSPIVSLCKPPEDGNRLTESVKLIKKRFRESFEVPVRDALSRPPENSAESPIAQAVIDISLSQYLRGEKNSLIVFSDMLENTSRFSMYKCTADGDVIRRFRESRVGAVERPAFSNTSVSINIIPRFGLRAEVVRCRDRLWPWFFGDDAGNRAQVQVEYLPGGEPVDGVRAAGAR